jgi:hypothetical protein
MKLNITRGKIARPQKIVIYAPEGIGKTTLAAACPDPLIIDLEQGSHHLDCARVEPTSYAQTCDIVKELAQGSDFSTVIIDTIDWLEEKMLEHVCKANNKASVEDFGYGKGYIVAAEEMVKFLTLLDKLAVKSNVILLAHSEVKRQELPDHPPFDRYQLKLAKQIAPVVKEWADAILFGSFKLAIRESDGRAKGVAARERTLRCAHSATADAKNRHGLQDVEPWDIATIRKILKSSVPAEPAEPTQPAATLREFMLTFLPYRDKVVDFLILRKELKEGQGLDDVSDEYRARVMSNVEAFKQAVGLEVAS